MDTKMIYIKDIKSYQLTEKIISNYLKEGYDVNIIEGSLINNYIIYNVINLGTINKPDYYNIFIKEFFLNSQTSFHKIYFTNELIDI